MTNEVTNVLSGVTNVSFYRATGLVAGPYHDWMIHVGDARFGLKDWGFGWTDIYILRHIAAVQFSAPVVAGAFILIVLLLLLAGYYLIANLRHKDAAGDA